MCSNPSIYTTQQYLFFFSEVLHEVWRIFPRLFDIVTSDVPTRYLIFCTKQTRKQSCFIDNIRHITWPFLNVFILPAAWHVFVQKHQKVCCSILQWSDVGTAIWYRTCTALLQEFIENIFKFSANLGVWNKSTVKSGIIPHWRFETCFFILSRVQREEFYYNKVISCKSYVQLLFQDVYSISSKTCQL